MPFGRGAPISALHDQFDFRGIIEPNTLVRSFKNLKIQEQLKQSLFLLDDRAIQWSLAIPGGIARGAEAFWSGHANDVVPLAGGGLLVASDTGGAWLVNQSNAVALSDTWAQPDLKCFIVGPTDTQILAAGRGLYVTDWTDNLPFLAWQPVPLPDAVDEIFAGIYVHSARAVVLADNIGVHWAAWPEDPAGPWLWTRVPVLQTGRYSGLAVGPDGTVAAAYWGINLTNAFYGIVRLRFENQSLAIAERATITGGVPDTDMACVKLTSSLSDPTRMYASVSSNAGWLLCVLASRDGGQTWGQCGTKLTTSIADQGDLLNAAGNQGNGYNNCIQASPVNPDIVLLGWRNSGVFLSTDGGQSWELRQADQTSMHLHSDAHAVRFDPRVSSGHRFAVCSDGGVTTTDDLGYTYSSIHNEGLPNLQFQSIPARAFDGTFAASPVHPGLIAGALQDNGIVWSRMGQDDSWHLIVAGDGYRCVLLHTGQLLFTTNTIPAPNACSWTGSGFSRHGPVPLTVPKPGLAPNTAGLYDLTPDSKNHWYRNTALAQVRKPHHRNTRGQLMYAVGSVYSDVYGLHANTDGGDAHWEYVGTVPIDASRFDIRSLASWDGHNMYVGTSDGRIFALDAQQGGALELNVTTRTGDGTAITCLLEYDAHGGAFAILGKDLLKQTNDFAFRKVGGLPDETLFAVEAQTQRGEPLVLVATDSRVYISRNGGRSWRGASSGLPERFHGADLRIGPSFGEDAVLYLSTFGRSVWRAPIPAA